MRTHPPWQRAHPAQNQPTVERRRDRAPDVLHSANPFEKIIFDFRDYDPARDIAMAAEIFRSGMHNQIRTKIERPFQHRRPGIVTNPNSTYPVNNLSALLNTD